MQEHTQNHLESSLQIIQRNIQFYQTLQATNNNSFEHGVNLLKEYCQALQQLDAQHYNAHASEKFSRLIEDIMAHAYFDISLLKKELQGTTYD